MSAGLATQLTLGLLCGAMIMAGLRLLLGPSSADRIVALDLLAVVIVAFVSCLGVIREQPIYLDIATSLAVIAFIGTVAYSRYLAVRKEQGR